MLKKTTTSIENALVFCVALITGCDLAAADDGRGSPNPSGTGSGSGNETEPGAGSPGETNGSMTGSDGMADSANEGSGGADDTNSSDTGDSTGNGVDDPNVVWQQDFENGPGAWSIEGGVWSIGAPIAKFGPDAVSGLNVVGTRLDGDYPAGYQDARVVSPEFIVPGAAEVPRLRLWQWFDFGAGDVGTLQIRIDGGSWQNVPGSRIHERNGGWAQQIVHLGQYAQESVQIGFYFDANSTGTALGWYIDDVSLEIGPMVLVDDGFENGFGDWSIEGGAWALGEPTAQFGPQANGGTQVMGTVLDGDYPNGYQDARLVTPQFTVPSSNVNPQLRVLQWYDFATGDIGRIEIRVDGGTWANVGGNLTDDSGGPWSQQLIPLDAYENENVQVAFYLDANSSGTALGWYIDNVAVVTD